MRRELFGLALVSLMVCGSVSSKAQTANPVSKQPEQAQTDARLPSSVTQPSQPGATHDAKSRKKVLRKNPDGSPDLRLLPLSSAAHASQTYDGTPASAPHRAAPATQSWTGFYVGGGVGAGTTQP